MQAARTRHAKDIARGEGESIPYDLQHRVHIGNSRYYRLDDENKRHA
ncbi:hypothetical protein ABI_33080 [Asticcacaulis biprosthecium C19]|uniref:Uncharacterized protein n=1 Tax=Asticcacaulis biprosthecium C19 TaxID=715226 RepID=F4QQ04_9CAUL|nr:hypothetical protein ABI_33080 [Asticcacaulis biprosthecium C19]